MVDHWAFQRLRRVSQTSLTSTVYPSATGSRFEHGLGAMHLAGRAWAAAWANGEPAQADFVAAVAAEFPTLAREGADRLAQHLRIVTEFVGLLHDVGHPPFSHVLENYYKRHAQALLRERPAELDALDGFGPAFHEFAGTVLVKEIVVELPEYLRKPCLAVYQADPDSDSWSGALHSIVAGEIDVDRLDYLMRDADKAGTEFGAIDYERLVDAMELHENGGAFRIAPGVRARSAVETLLLQRSQSYRWITYHPRVVSTNAALSRTLGALDELSTSDAKTADQEAASIVDAILPNLNYFAASAHDVSRATGVDLQAQSEPAEGDPGTLFEQKAAEKLERLATEVQAGVDDATVVELLKRAALIAAQLEPGFKDTPRAICNRIVTLAHVALFREKSAIPVWKTQDEFAAVVRHTDGFVDALEAVVREVYDEVAHEAPADARDIFAARRDALLALLSQSPPAAFNSISHEVFSLERMRDALETRLNLNHPTLRKTPGFWVVEYTRFQPIRNKGQLSVLYRGEDPIELRASSPVIQGLEHVEALRPRFAAFFFLSHPASATPWHPDEGREARAWLAGKLLDTMPQFLREVWADLLKLEYLAQPSHPAPTKI